MRLVLQRTGETMADAVEIAATRASRRKGLLGRDSLAPEKALVLSPCFSVHTAFMRFAIDVVFVDCDGVVRKIVSLPPWRIAADIGASAVVEMAAGGAQGLRPGDRIYLSDASGVLASSSFSSPSLRSTASNPACSGS
jgi:uncharacterized membrane protein (UPF0127 family)